MWAGAGDAVTVCTSSLSLMCFGFRLLNCHAGSFLVLLGRKEIGMLVEKLHICLSLHVGVSSSSRAFLVDGTKCPLKSLESNWNDALIGVWRKQMVRCTAVGSRLLYVRTKVLAVTYSLAACSSRSYSVTVFTTYHIIALPWRPGRVPY